MSEEATSHRPTGKRQRTGASTVTTSSYEASKVTNPSVEDQEGKVGGGILKFPAETVSEVRKVIWPTGRQMITYTSVVFAFLVFMIILVWGTDALAALGVEQILSR